MKRQRFSADESIIEPSCKKSKEDKLGPNQPKESELSSEKPEDQEGAPDRKNESSEKSVDHDADSDRESSEDQEDKKELEEEDEAPDRENESSEKSEEEEEAPDSEKESSEKSHVEEGEDEPDLGSYKSMGDRTQYEALDGTLCLDKKQGSRAYHFQYTSAQEAIYKRTTYPREMNAHKPDVAYRTYRLIEENPFWLLRKVKLGAYIVNVDHKRTILMFLLSQEGQEDIALEITLPRVEK